MWRAVCVLILGVAVALMIGCGGSDDPPAGTESKTAHLYQASPGAPTSIRMGWARDSVPDPSSIVAWFVYRGSYYGLLAEPQNLIDAIGAQDLRVYEDAGNAASLNYSTNFSYTRRDNPEQGSIDATYTRPPLMAGQTYYYRARRVVSENSMAPPISSAQVSTLQVSTLQVDPPSALSQPSAPQGPVTYFVAPAPVKPSAGSATVDATNAAFQWSTSTGADEYMIRIYDNYSVTGNPVVQSPIVRPGGTVGVWTYTTGGGNGALRGSQYYYWVVCARKSGEVTPTCGEESGWVKSSVRQFMTAPTPPGIP